MMKHVIYTLLLSFGLLAEGYAQGTAKEPDLFKFVDKQRMDHWVDSVFNSMSDDERIGQLFMVIADLGNNEPNRNKLTGYVRKLHIGGVLFHKGSIYNQADLCNMMQAESSLPLLVSLDGEWGLAMRLEGTVRFPKNMMLGAITEGDSLLVEYGKEVGRQCRELGIHINFAPDLDINSNADNPVIGMRSFGEDKLNVTRKGLLYAKGLESMNVLSVAKHFPGHGDTSGDSHKTLPVLWHSQERLDSIELYPFKKYIEAGLGGMMTGHLFVPAINGKSEIPTSLSSKTIEGLLKETLGFRGLCFTDALAMKGANYKTNPSVMALLAGNDILLGMATPEKDFAAVKSAIAQGLLSMDAINAKCLKILRYKYILGLAEYKPICKEGLANRLNTPYAEWLAAKLNEEAITVVKNTDGMIPLRNLGRQKIASLCIGDDFGGHFQNTLAKYGNIDCYKITVNSSQSERNAIIKKLEAYDTVICSVHTARFSLSGAMGNLAEKTKLVYVFFTTPYFCESYKGAIKKARAVVIGYEDTPLARKYAAQVVFGGIAAKGALPVTIPGLYPVGTGIRTEKCRLGYHCPEEVGLDAEKLSQIDSIAEEGIKAKAYPGCYVLVAKDGMVVYEKPFGYLDYNYKQRVSDETVYDLASASKATGTLLSVMKAYDFGKFKLNDRISEFIPELKQSDKENLRIKELLYHESGVIPTILFYEDAINKDSYEGELFSGRKDALHPIRFDRNTYVRKDFAFLPQYVSSVKKEGFQREIARGMYVCDTFDNLILRKIKDSKVIRRGKYKYSCVNFIMLKMMVEKIMQQPMDRLLDENFFNPLGAYSTTYNPLQKMDTSKIAPTEKDPFLRRQHLRGYVHDEAAAFQGGVSGNAGLFSNANDLCKVLQLYLNNGEYGGERFLSEQTCRLFTTSKSANSHRGLGFDKPYMPNPRYSPCGALAPASVFGHTGYTGTCFWVDPDNGLIYIFLTNRVNPTRENNRMGRMDIRTRIQDAIYQSMKKD